MSAFSLRVLWLRTLLFASGLLGLGACSPFVKYVEAPLDAALHARILTDRSLDARAWSLSELIADACEHHPDILVARTRYDGAVAAIRTAGERPNPTVGLTPQIVTPYTALIAGTYGVDFDWTFETAGKRNHRLASAHARVRSAAASVVDAIWTVRSGVRSASLDLYAAQERSRLLGEAVTKQNELLDALNDRVAAGEETRQVSSQARLLLAQLRLQSADSETRATLARAALAESLAMSVEGLAGATFSGAAFRREPRTIPDRTCALTHRANLLSSLGEYAAAEADLRLEISKQYPDLHLNPGYSLDAGENKWTLGIGLTLPLLNHNEGAIGEAEIKRKEMAAVFDSLQNTVLADYERALLSLRAARRKEAATESLLAEQARQIETEKRLLEAGNGDRAALLSAEVERATTVTARLEARVEIQAAIGMIEVATQTPADLSSE